MTLLEEKKLVLGELLGFHEHPSTEKIWIKEDDYYFIIEDWNPQVTRDPWDRIWQAMDDKMLVLYLEKLDSMNPGERLKIGFQHKAKPQICWKALIKVLKEIK